LLGPASFGPQLGDPFSDGLEHFEASGGIQKTVFRNEKSVCGPDIIQVVRVVCVAVQITTISCRSTGGRIDGRC
jgi:hypothetical protein